MQPIMLMDSRERYVSVYSKSSASHKVLFECLTVIIDESMHMTPPYILCAGLFVLAWVVWGG